MLLVWELQFEDLWGKEILWEKISKGKETSMASEHRAQKKRITSPLRVHFPLTHFIILSPEHWPVCLRNRHSLIPESQELEQDLKFNRNSSNWVTGVVDADRRDNSELREEREKGESSRSQCFRQGLWAEATRKVAVVWEPGWDNMAFTKVETVKVYILF